MAETATVRKDSMPTWGKVLIILLVIGLGIWTASMFLGNKRQEATRATVTRVAATQEVAATPSAPAEVITSCAQLGVYAPSCNAACGQLKVDTDKKVAAKKLSKETAASLLAGCPQAIKDDYVSGECKTSTDQASCVREALARDGIYELHKRIGVPRMKLVDLFAVTEDTNRTAKKIEKTVAKIDKTTTFTKKMVTRIDRTTTLTAVKVGAVSAPPAGKVAVAPPSSGKQTVVQVSANAGSTTTKKDGNRERAQSLWERLVTADYNEDKITMCNTVKEIMNDAKIFQPIFFKKNWSIVKAKYAMCFPKHRSVTDKIQIGFRRITTDPTKCGIGYDVGDRTCDFDPFMFAQGVATTYTLAVGVMDKDEEDRYLGHLFGKDQGPPQGGGPVGPGTSPGQAGDGPGSGADNGGTGGTVKDTTGNQNFLNNEAGISQNGSSTISAPPMTHGAVENVVQTAGTSSSSSSDNSAVSTGMPVGPPEDTGLDLSTPVGPEVVPQ